MIDRTADALSEQGEGFDVTSSFGAVVLPDDASQPQDALRLADERLYAQKHGKRAQRDRPHETLLQALYEKEPDLHVHVEDVADLARRRRPPATGSPGRSSTSCTGRRSCTTSARSRSRTTSCASRAQLDRGGMGVRAPPHDRRRAHPDRVTGAAARGPDRPLHARALGRGRATPTGSLGERIPLAARIIAVCDAYHAMTTTRPYRGAMPVEDALDGARPLCRLAVRP